MSVSRMSDSLRCRTRVGSFSADDDRTTEALCTLQPRLEQHSDDLLLPPISHAHFRTHSVPELLSHVPSTRQVAGDSNGKKPKHISWLPTLRKSSPSPAHQARAWIGGHQGRLGYNVTSLANAERIPELWTDSGDIFVYLFPPASGSGPSFKLQSSLIASSRVLGMLTHESSTCLRWPPSILSLDSSSAPETVLGTNQDGDTSRTSDQTLNLVLPLDMAATRPRTEASLTDAELDNLITVRNLFAFLLGQSLVCTETCPSLFATLLRIADLLRAYDFTNMDGTTLGEVAAQSFDNYVSELGLADVRGSRERTIEALILGERMRSVMLYNEAFTHAVGKFRSLQDTLKQPHASVKFQMLSTSTRTRLERAAIDLDTRQKNVNARLAAFEFPSVFAGIASSKTAEERKYISFDAWKSGFAAARKQTIGYYKSLYGSWPPKTNQKGLNRLVLKQLNDDFAELYDLWVDRTALTSRTEDLALGESLQPAHRAIRQICDEYDRSIPPVQPPIPFDVPILPNFHTTRSDYGLDPKKDHKERNKRLCSLESHLLLETATNPDAVSGAQRSPFGAAMVNWERKQAHGSSFNELCDLRCGAWIFLYVIIQSLPMLTVDAPGIRFSAGVEYFLCEPSRSGVPWSGMQSGAGRRNFYRISGGDERVVRLPSDLVEHGVEGIYQRSHCWLKAAEWSHDPCLADASSTLQCEYVPDLPYQTLSYEQRDSCDSSTYTIAPPPISARAPSVLPCRLKLPGYALSASSHQQQSVNPQVYSMQMKSSRPSSDHDGITTTHSITTHADAKDLSKTFGSFLSYQSRPASPATTVLGERQRDSVLASGLEELPAMYHKLISAMEHGRDISRGSGEE